MQNKESTSLMKAAYRDLGYLDSENCGLFAATNMPGNISSCDWLEKGDWLATAAEVGVERIFFIDNSPVAVFAQESSRDLNRLVSLFKRVWSMSRPRFFFLSTPGELSVYDLAKRPPKNASEFDKTEPLETVRSVAKVAEKLKFFRREALEAGYVFDAEYRFGNLNDRADKALIKDLKSVRRKLIEEGLGGDQLKFAHSLIGRSIFIRYLEDRRILTRKTYDELAKNSPRRASILNDESDRQQLRFGQKDSLYLKVLQDKEFTFALFKKLAEDFNGDMFPDIEQEYESIGQRHLDLIRDLLFGDTEDQRSLFFYAYRFEVVPIELISSIYEEFYHEKNGSGRVQGVYYTPPALVEFLLSQTLDAQTLSSSPQIMDAACGSGIFLVEAFRRIVRYRTTELGRRLRFDELVGIFRDQLRGVDINGEAIRIASFSLSLALLHYLEPRDIREQIQRGNRLPNLLFDPKRPKSFNTLVKANSFDMEFFESIPELNKNFTSNCADIVVGNPPWGSPGKKEEEARRQNKMAMDWCEKRNFPVGDRERSQAFIWRALDMLKPGGIAGLYVSTGVFFKHHKNSVLFRTRWLDLCILDRVFNFAHTRNLFFRGAVSPFAAVLFRNEKNKEKSHFIHYWSSKHTKTIKNLQSVVFSANDIRRIRFEDDLADYRTWKTFLWGNRRDKALVGYLKSFKSLSSLILKEKTGLGFERANRKFDADWLLDYKALPINYFSRYGPVTDEMFEEPPSKVKRRGKRGAYEGLRILVKRGIEQNSKPKGAIVARLAERPFCFTNDIHGIKISAPEIWKYKIILGILWSSLARYFFFTTSANWGLLHDEIHLHDELLHLPVRFQEKGELKARIIDTVDKLRNLNPKKTGLPQPDSFFREKTDQEIQRLENRLDSAIFELFELGEAEIDLIRDMCDTNIDFFYLKEHSAAVKPLLENKHRTMKGTATKTPYDILEPYIQAFIQVWSPYIEPETKLLCRLHMPPNNNAMLAAEFLFTEKDESMDCFPEDAKEAWSDILRRLDDAFLQPLSTRIYIDGLVRVVADDRLIIVKRNEKRLWTKTMAREDAEATIVQAMNRQRMAGEL